MADTKRPKPDQNLGIRTPEIRSPGIAPVIWNKVEMRPAAGGGPPSLGVAEGEAAAFQASLERDPAAALAGLGIGVTPDEARRVSQRIAEIKAGGTGTTEMKIKVDGTLTVGGTIKFGKN